MPDMDSKKLEKLYSKLLAKRKKIEDNLQYPGQIKVVVIRETRSIEYAK